jgi:signal transduction histidine kinase
MKQHLSHIVICEKCGRKNRKDAPRCVHCGNELKKDYYRGLWLKNLVITFGLFLIPLLILFYIVDFEISKHFENQVKQGLMYSVDVNSRTIVSFLEERKSDLLSIARFNVLHLSEIRQRTHFLESFVLEKPWFDFIAIADFSGEIVYSTDKRISNVRDRNYFQKALQGTPYNSGIFHSDLLDTTAMIIAVPIHNRDDSIVGVMFASLCLNTFYNLILDLRIGETSEVFLVDDDGYFLSPSRLGGEVLKEHGHFKNEPNPHAGSEGVLIHRDYRGKKVICAYKRLDILPGYLVSEMDVEEALAPVTRLKHVMFSIFVIFGGVLILTSALFSKRITSVLKSLTRSLKAAFDDVSQKKNTINAINVELRERLHQCELLSNQLQASESYIKNIVNSITSGLIAIGRDMRITYHNEHVKLYAKDGHVPIDADFFAVFPVLDHPDMRTRLSVLFKNTEHFRIPKLPVNIHKTRTMLSIAGFPMMNGEHVTGATLLVNDITEQEQLRAQMADYEKLSALSQLALGAAHEINNPLQGVTSYIELLLEEEKDIEKKSQAKEVLESAYRISETVRGLLNFARPTPPKFTKISINRLIEETISFLRHQPLFRKMKIVKNLSDAVPLITADVNQIRQVLINVLINAAQAMNKGGTLTLSTHKMKFEDSAEITIVDTGTGIPEENLTKVFDPFFTTKKGEGTGLGLSISYSYVKSHNGHMSISSKTNEGTAVTILLPIRQEGHSPQEVTE